MIPRNKKPAATEPAPPPVQQPATKQQPKQTAQVVPVQKAATFHEIPVLNAGQTECLVHNNVLQIGNQIYFMLPTLDDVSIGKIELFSKPGGCAWMYLQDVQTGDKHWVSVFNWAQYQAAGTFEAITIKKPEPKPISEKPAF